MEYTFEKLSLEHQDEVMEIFNYYVKETTAAYREEVVEKDYFLNFLEVTENYPGFAIKEADNKIIGFCMLKPHIALSTFSEAADIMYFIHHEYTGRGIGLLALKKLENEAIKIGIKKLLASICSENSNSISFHKKNGFSEYGRLPDIGKKFGRYFSIVWMGKDLL